MAARTIDLVVPVVSCPSTPSMFVDFHALGPDDELNSPNFDPPYPAYGGIYREEAIMLLRRFYVQQNEKGRSRRPFAEQWRPSLAESI